MPKGRPKKAAKLSREDEEKLVALIAEEFCHGKSAQEITDHVKSVFQTSSGEKLEGFTREMPYRYLRHAAQRKWLQFIPSSDDALGKSITDRFTFLRQSRSGTPPVSVVRSTSLEAVAQRTAEVMLQLIREKGKEKKAKCISKDREPDPVRVGFSGGRAMRLVAEALGRLLNQSTQGLPSAIIWIALHPALDANSPELDPNYFLTGLQRAAAEPKEGPPIRCSLVPLEVPPAVTSSVYDALLEMPSVRIAKEESDKLDVLCTGVGNFHDKHSILRLQATHYNQLFQVLPDAHSGNTERPFEAPPPNQLIDFLDGNGCEGDLLWLPFSKKGPIDYDQMPALPRAGESVGGRKKFFRPFTLLQLGDVQKAVEGGTAVVVACGLCQHCFQDKGSALATVLGLSETKPLLTHLVLDSLSASKVISIRDRNTPAE